MRTDEMLKVEELVGNLEAENARLLEIVQNVKVIHVGADLYVGLTVPGRGFCSAKVTAGFNPIAWEWEQKRIAAIAKATEPTP
jgi:hypothetical protein